MITVNDRYKIAMNADTELMECQADLNIVPPGADEGVTVEATKEADLSFLQQVASGNNSMSNKWGSLEKNRIVLDGSIAFCSVDGLNQYGYWSDAICDDSGVFAETPIINYNMSSEYDLLGVSIVFDDMGGEYATELTLAYYNAGDELLLSVDYTNTETKAYFEQKQTGVKRIELTVKAWSKAQRRCKVCQIIPGTNKVFSADNIISFETTEVITPFGSSITFPEYTLTLDNSDGQFNILNPDGMIQYLRQKMLTIPKLCLIDDTRIDSIQMGKYYLYSFPQDDNSNEIEITCRPSLAFMQDNYTLTSKELQTVEDACKHIFDNTNVVYYVDNDIKDIKVNTYIGNDITKLDAMAQLAIAACAYWKFNRDGSISLKSYAMPDATNDLTYDKLYSKPTVSQATNYTACKVKYYIYSSGKLSGTDVSVETGTGGDTLSVPTSYFISNEGQAEAVAMTALQYNQYKLTYKADYRGDPSIEVSDCVNIEHDYGTAKMFITKHVLTFDSNGLSGTVTGVGVD